MRSIVSAFIYSFKSSARDEWCRAKDVQMQTGMRTQHPHQHDKARRAHLVEVSRGSGTFTGGGPKLAMNVWPEWGLE